MNEHVRFVQKLLRSHVRKRTRVSKAQIEAFLRNLEWVIHGIRPAFSPEGIALPDDALLELIKEVKPVIDTTNTANDLCILSLKDDRFIASMKHCKRHLELIANRQLGLIFVDISKAHTKPIIADYKDLTSVQQGVKACLNALIKAQNSDSTANIQLVEEQKTNLCTLFGCILGYPVIYYFDGSEGENCLSMVPLNIVKILASSDSNQLLSFSYPASLEDYIKPTVKTWCRKFAEDDETVTITQETTEMPYIVL